MYNIIVLRTILQKVEPYLMLGYNYDKERKVKKYFIVFLILFINVLFVSAEEISGFKYKGISLKSKISYNSSLNKWTKGCSGDKCFIKTKGFGVFSDYLNTDKSFAFTTDCEFEFITDGKFIGYSKTFAK